MGEKKITPAEAIAILARPCVAAERKYGIPAELALGQALLESGNLNSCEGFNLHGIKYNGSRHHAKQLLTTREWMVPSVAQQWVTRVPGREIVKDTGKFSGDKKEYIVKDWFAAFSSYEDCIQEHAMLLSGTIPYRKMWAKYLENLNLGELIQSLQGVYATAPNYAEALRKVISPAVIAACEAERKAL